MSRTWLTLSLLPAAFLIGEVSKADDPPSTPPPAWATKQTAEWSQDEAQQVLSDSPWAKSVVPSVIRGNPNNNGYNQAPPMRRRGGFGFPGQGYPGGGYPGGGGGYPGNQYPPQNRPAPANDDSTRDQPPPKLTLRWESALPVRAAELKTRDVNAPTLEDENHYALAVYGIPANMVSGDAKQLADEAKKKASLSRDNKKDMKPTSVQVLRREDGPVVLFLFQRPKSAKEAIGKDDRRVEFDAQIGKLSVSQAFYVEDMVFQGKPEF
jgi:hypothetical protein